MDEFPVPYFHTLDEWKALCARRDQERADLQREGQRPGARAQRFAPAPSGPEAAARLFDELERMRLVNPVWWAKESRPFYAAALGWTLKRLGDASPGPDKQRLYSLATTCYYQLGLYVKWEAGQTLVGKTSAREIEKALKWDGKTFSYQGKGYEIVTVYLNCRASGEVAGDGRPRREAPP